MTESMSTSSDSTVRGPDPDLVIPGAHMASEEFVDLVVETLESSAYIEVHRLTKVDGKCDILINEVEPDDQA
jgi:hypothetical protein